MGDDGVLYRSLPPEMPSLYRTLVFPLAYSIKLNQTELEHLTDMKITKEEEAWKAIEALHAFGPKHVVVSSVGYLGDHIIGILASTKDDKTDSYQRYTMQVAKRQIYYTGTGDLFSALLMAWLHKQNYEGLGEAVAKVVSSLQQVLDNSADAENEKLRLKEIRLIKSATDILHPTKVLEYHTVTK